MVRVARMAKMKKVAREAWLMRVARAIKVVRLPMHCGKGGWHWRILCKGQLGG